MDDKLGGFSVRRRFIVLGNKLARTVSLFLEDWVIIVPGFFGDWVFVRLERDEFVKEIRVELKDFCYEKVAGFFILGVLWN